MASILFLIFIFSIIISYSLIPLNIKLGRKLSILDKPDFRKEHSKPQVRLGGISIYLGLTIPILLAYCLNIVGMEMAISVKVFFIGTFLFFALGILEDIFHLSFLTKLILQIIFSSYFWFNGIALELLDLPIFEFIRDPNLYAILSYVTTVLWFVGIVNAINWVDGLDGLASGLVIISVIGFCLILKNTSQISFPIVLAVSIIGSNLGFIKHNFYPAKIFMGDGGSFFLGSLIAYLSISNNIFYSYEEINLSIILSKCFFVGLPLFDMAYVIISRIVQKKSPFYPDRQHFHYKVIDSGISHRGSVNICYVISVLFILLGLYFYGI